MSEEDKSRANVIAGYLVVCIAALLVVLLAYWPRPVHTDDPNDPNLGSARVAEPNETATEDVTGDGKPVDGNKPANAGQTRQTPKKPGSNVVSAAVRYDVSAVEVVILAMAMGALGACLHGMTSLVYHLGKGDFAPQWTLWYVCRPFVGGLLALIFYLIIAGGLMPQVGSSGSGLFRMIGLAGLIGLFSKQALNTLSRIFDVIFTSDKKYEKLNQGNGQEDEPPAPPKPNPTPNLNGQDRTPDIQPSDKADTPAKKPPK